MLVHPNIDPIAFSIGPLAVRWYGLMYLLGFAAGWWLGNYRIRKGLAPVTRQQFDDLIFLAVLGVILGGRLGYVLFYKPGPKGQVSALFLLGYGTLRFIAEFAREPDAFLGYLTFGMTMGQWLCLPMVIGGIALWIGSERRTRT